MVQRHLQEKNYKFYNALTFLKLIMFQGSQDTLKGCSQQQKVNMKARKIKEQSEEINEKTRTSRKMSLSRSILLRVNRPLDLALPISG